MIKQFPEIQRDTPDADEALVIQVRLRQLAEERCKLLCQLNDVQAATRSLPPEILSEIFTIHKTPLLFGATCRLWRDVAWNTPQLWTTIRCGSARRARRAGSQWDESDNGLYILRLFFKNSRQLKVTIDLDIDRKDITKYPAMICDLLAFVAIEQSNRIQQLSLNSSTWAIEEWSICYPFLATAKLFNIETLQLRGDLLSSTFRNAPQLRNLSVLHLRRADSLRDQSFWNQLTILRLEATAVVHCLELLRHHPPNLEIFKCIDPTTDPRSFPNPEITEIIAPSHLKTFGWTGQFGNFEEFFWRYIRLPAIRNLSWDFLSPLSESCERARRDFFHNLPSLEVLHIQHCNSIHELRDVLQNLKSLRELHLDARSLEGEDVNIMDILTLRDDPDHPNLLPNLKVLRLDVLVGCGLSRMLVSRRGKTLPASEARCLDMVHRGVYAHLEEAVICVEEPAYERDEREVLRGLINGGLRLDIVSGGTTLEWCKCL